MPTLSSRRAAVKRGGLTQEELACYLRVSKGMVSQYENLRKSLGTAAELRLSAFIRLRHAIPESISKKYRTVENSQVNAVVTGWKKKLISMERDISMLQYQYKVMLLKQKQVRSRLRSIGLLLLDHPELKLQARDKAWINKMGSDTEKLFLNNNKAAEIQLQVRIGLLKAQVSVYKRFINQGMKTRIVSISGFRGNKKTAV